MTVFKIIFGTILSTFYYILLLDTCILLFFKPTVFFNCKNLYSMLVNDLMLELYTPCGCSYLLPPFWAGKKESVVVVVVETIRLWCW